MPIDESGRCIRCGGFHDDSPEVITKYCLAVKKVYYTGYVYGPGGTTVNHPGISAIEYVELDEQIKLREISREGRIK